MSNVDPDGQHPLDPESALKLIGQQQVAVASRASRIQATLFAIWGIAYLVGFGVLALDPRTAVEDSWQIVVFGVAMMLGTPAYLSIMALLGGGGFLVGAAATLVIQRQGAQAAR